MTSRPRSQLARHSACARTSTHVHVRVTRTSSPDSRDRDHLLPPSRCDTAGLARRACSGEAGLLRGGELGRSRRASCGCSSRTSRVQRQVWWISLSPHNPAQVRCCAVQLQHTTVVGLAAWRGTSFMAVDFSSPRDDATFHHMALFFISLGCPSHSSSASSISECVRSGNLMVALAGLNGATPSLRGRALLHCARTAIELDGTRSSSC